MGLYNVLNLETEECVTVEVFSDEMVKRDGEYVLYKEWNGIEDDVFLKQYNSLANFGNMYGFWRMANEYGENVVIGIDGGRGNIHRVENYVNSMLLLSWTWYLDGWHCYKLKRIIFGCPSVSKEMFGCVCDYCTQKIHPTEMRKGTLLTQCLYQFRNVAEYVGFDVSKICSESQIRNSIRAMSLFPYHLQGGSDHSFCGDEEYWWIQLTLEDFVEGSDSGNLVNLMKLFIEEFEELMLENEEEICIENLKGVIKDISSIEIPLKRERYIISRYIQGFMVLSYVVDKSDLSYSYLKKTFTKPPIITIAKALKLKDYKSTLNKGEIIELLLEVPLNLDVHRHTIMKYIHELCSGVVSEIRYAKLQAFMKENKDFKLLKDYEMCFSFYVGEFGYCPRNDLIRIRESIGTSLNEAWNSANNEAAEKGEKSTHLTYEGRASSTYFEWQENVSNKQKKTSDWLGFDPTKENIFMLRIDGESVFSRARLLKLFMSDPFSCYDKYLLNWNEKFEKPLSKADEKRLVKLDKLSQKEKDELKMGEFVAFRINYLQSLDYSQRNNIFSQINIFPDSQNLKK